jgi:hypothetical protein
MMYENIGAFCGKLRELCLSDAVYLFQIGRKEEAEARLEKAAQYAWGFKRPRGW